MGADIEQFKNIISDAMRLGTRCITFSMSGPTTIRLFLEPERNVTRNLNVFLAHATADRKWADEVHALLHDAGFTVTYLRSDAASQVQNESAISQKLLESVWRSDYLCVLVSRRSAVREWVRFELRYGAYFKGRVVIVTEPGYDVREFQWPPFIRRALLTTHYYLIEYRPDHPQMREQLARCIINDKEEGVTDGTFRPLTVRERNLHLENVLRQYARRNLDDFEEYTSRHVVDVLPFTWDRIGIAEGDPIGAFRWFVTNHGRLNTQVQVARRNWQLSSVTIPADEEVVALTPDGSLHALVLWKSEWEKDDDERLNTVWLWPAS